MIPIFRNLSDDRVNEYAMVLASGNISCRLIRSKPGWTLLVPENHAQAAIDLVAQYVQENRLIAADDSPAFLSGGLKTYSSVWVALFLVIVHVAISLSGNREHIFRLLGASADRILDGELFRCVTALLLHGDSRHLIGNLFGIVLFGTAVCSHVGWGVGWGMILVGGAAGNALNAFFYQRHHLSIGASTAIFGAVGILCTFAIISGIRRQKKLVHVFLPLGAGLGLLTFLGAGMHSDLLAHLFGFIVGLLVGGGICLVEGYATSLRVQTAAALFAVATVAGSWIKGIINSVHP